MKIPHTKDEEESTWTKVKNIDWIGVALLTVGATFFLIGLSTGGVDHPWASAFVLSFMLIGVLIIVAFAMWEAYGVKGGRGILSIEFYKNPQILSAFFCALMAGMLFFGLVYYSPV
jgi:uncharacterized membrane protein